MRREHDTLFLNIDGKFTLQDNFPSFPGEGLYCMLVDVTRDGLIDVIRLDTSHKLSVFKNSPTGFEDITYETNLPSYVDSVVAIASVFRRQSIVVISLSGSLEFYPMAQLSSTTNTTNSYSRLSSVEKAIVFDMDNDGLLDIITISHSSPTIEYNLGHGRFFSVAFPIVSPKEVNQMDFVISDFDNNIPEYCLFYSWFFYIPNICFQISSYHMLDLQISQICCI
jgi:hypothetical protein